MSIALADLSDWDSLPAPPDPAPAPAAVEVRTVFRGVVTNARVLSFAQPPRARWQRNFTIGSEARVDAPVAADFVPWPSHPLVMAAGTGYVVNVTPQMTGRIRVRGQVRALASFVRENGNTFALPATAVAQLDCGATSFIVAPTSAPRALPTPPWRWDWGQHGYALASALALGALLLVTAFVPADRRSLSLDLLGAENHYLTSLVKPPEQADPLPWLTAKRATDRATGASASRAQRAEAQPGVMGDSASPRRMARFAVRGAPPERDPILAKTRAIDAIQRAGVLGVLRAEKGGALASLFGAETAFGADAASVLGNLMANEIGPAFGGGGLGVLGTGAGAAGTGNALVGISDGLHLMGQGISRPGGGHGGSWPGGALPARHAAPPHWVGVDPHVRGALDKEIVRRVIRLHLNEIKYCYDQELSRTPTLAGRVLVQFTIVASGQVIAAVMQSSTMGNPRVENCTVQAVRRWQFPQPSGGGLVTVSYPFVMTPSGS